MSASGDDAFGKASMQRINVLSIQRISAEDRAKIEAVDPAIELTDAGGWYDGEIRETWPAFTTARYLVPGATGSGTRGERDRLLDRLERPLQDRMNKQLPLVVIEPPHHRPPPQRIASQQPNHRSRSHQ